MAFFLSVGVWFDAWEMQREEEKHHAHTETTERKKEGEEKEKKKLNRVIRNPII